MAKPETMSTTEATGTLPHVVARADGGERHYLVLETIEIPRGGASFLLRKGKTISSHGYDIDQLRKMGAHLEEARV